jgi:hypothetical protein
MIFILSRKWGTNSQKKKKTRPTNLYFILEDKTERSSTSYLYKSIDELQIAGDKNNLVILWALRSWPVCCFEQANNRERESAPRQASREATGRIKNITWGMRTEIWYTWAQGDIVFSNKLKIIFLSFKKI